MTTTNTYVPTFVRQELKWYERDKLRTWYDHRKCKDFLDELDKDLENAKIVNFDIINKCVRGQVRSQLTLQNYQTIEKKQFLNIRLRKEKKLCLLP